MKVLHLVYSFRTGGIETMLVNIANEQAKLGHEIFIVVLNDNIDKALLNRLDANVNFICLGKKLGSHSPLCVLKLNYYIARISPDIIHLHYSGIYKLIILPKFKRKCCVTSHDVCVFPYCKSLIGIKHIFAISNVVKEDLMNKLHLNSELVLNGIDVESFKHAKKSRTSFFRIVVISRLMHSKKGQDVLIQALGKVFKKGIGNFQLDIIGEGPSLDFLRNLVAENGLSSKINFLGNKSQNYLFEHLCEYDLCVQPSRYEGFGLTVAEAMAAKVPVLVSANEGPLEIIDNGRYGFYFNNGDIDDCARALVNIISDGVDACMIESAYNRVKTMYNVQNTARTYLHKYECISGK